jgi:hypothetical protein
MAESMLESVIGSPDLDEDEEDTEATAEEDPRAKKKRALRSLASALGVKVKDLDAAAEAFGDAVDACLEYESPEE